MTARKRRAAANAGTATDEATGTAAIARTPIEPAYLAKPRYQHTLKAADGDRPRAPRHLPARGPRRMDPARRTGGPDRPPPRLRRGSHRAPAAHPPRAHARVAVRLLPRRRPDHGRRPRHARRPPGYTVQACGDCHLLNFGAFATPERRVIFDINDFDETFPAPWEWDLKRLAASIVVASRANRPPARRRARRPHGRPSLAYAQDDAPSSPRMRTLDAWYASIDWEEVIDRTGDTTLRQRRAAVLEKAPTA